MTLVVCCCSGLAFSNIHHILQRVHLVLVVIRTPWQDCHYFLSDYNVAVVLVHGSLLVVVLVGCPRWDGSLFIA